MNCKLPNDFCELLTKRYEEALLNKHILFNGDQAVHTRLDDTVGNTKMPTKLTLLTSLMHRPEKSERNSNPFEKPEPELTILESFGPLEEFKIVFNKFPVVPLHFMMITKEFNSQNAPLNENELSCTYCILQKLKESSEDKWFAFYNCGTQSGASQAHKHIQFMTFPKDFSPFIEDVALKSPSFLPNNQEKPLQNKELPFSHYIGRLPSEDNSLLEDDLSSYYVSLLQRTISVLKHFNADNVSYNFIMTTEYMMMVPRSTGKYNNLLGVNSCGYAGLFLCKNQETFNVVNEDHPAQILKACGYPRIDKEETMEYDY